jgi:SprT-like family
MIPGLQYRAFQEAYDFFNLELFGHTLPQVLVTLQRKGKAKGYFAPKRFTGRVDDKSAVHELATNPDCFVGRDDESILSTLAHEMAHVWKQTHGTSSRRSYHDREWGTKMKERNWAASFPYRRTGRKGNRPEGDTLHRARWQLRESVCKAPAERVFASLAIVPGWKRSQGESGEQDEIRLP